jgi:prepilin-type N-terminal cleavage/methylation domain-containing protein
MKHAREQSVGALSKADVRREHCADRGFTLLELLCAMAIIILLVGLVLGAVARARSKTTNLTTYVEQGQESIERMQGPGGLLSAE